MQALYHSWEFAMDLLIETSGHVRCLYDEAIDLTALGSLRITRGSHVEPDGEGRWLADLSPVAPGIVLGPFERRSDALAAEREWLLQHWLTPAE
jgi:hypothetical protein